jgi:predicted acyl esterase
MVGYRLPFAAVVKIWLAGLGAALVLFAGDATGATVAKQDLSIPMDDGVSIAATLYLPDGSPPSGGWPAIVFLHGLGGNREQMNALVEGYGPFESGYAMLTFDARGHGQSGGLVSIDGPREIEDMKEIEAWLAARPDVSDTKIGAWGISYGGGAILDSLVAGVPWAAVVTVETWTDLYSALVPQGLLKSGLVAGLAGSIPDAKKSPELTQIQALAFSGQSPAAVKAWADARSSISRLGSITTPVFMAQGRRDFLFGIDQGAGAFKALRGPKELYVGLHGHPPSTFPALDTPLLLWRSSTWFDCYLRNLGCPLPEARVEVVPENFSGNSDVGVAKLATLPKTKARTVVFPGVATFAHRGKAVRTSAPLATPIEVFGSPTVTVSVSPSGGWSRLVAVLTARTPQGKQIVVSEGGIPTRSGTTKYVIRLIDQATLIPKGSRLTLTLGASSLAQNPSNLLYLDLPMAATARVRIGNAVVVLPSLRTPISR